MLDFLSYIILDHYYFCSVIYGRYYFIIIVVFVIDPTPPIDMFENMYQEI